MACVSILKNVNIHVWERGSEDGSFERISCFDRRKSKKIVNILHSGGIHFDALVLPPSVEKKQQEQHDTQRQGLLSGLRGCCLS